MRRQASRDTRRAAAVRDGVPALGDVLEFMRLIWGISHGLQATSKRMEADLGMTGPQRLVVRIVGRCPGTSAGELAQILRLHPSTLTGILRRLEDRGVLERTPGERDRRLARFRLTPTGRANDRLHAGTVEAAVRRLLSDLEPDQISTAAEVLRALEMALGAAGPTRSLRSRQRQR
jgi:MarR family transcriptional regulator, organic hydroperoxide resistance regulator